MMRPGLRDALVPLLLTLLAGEPCAASGAHPSGDEEIDRLVSLVSDTSVQRRIAELQGFGTRHCNNPNRWDVAAWVAGELRATGVVDVAPDSFLQAGYWQTNIVGTIRGSVAPEKEIIIGAHTDSYSYDLSQAPGADDNASGTSAVVEIARAIATSGYRPALTIRFIGFAAEEVGLRGARSYAARARAAGRQIIAMLNFDMIAHQNWAQAPNQFSIVWYPGAEWLARLDSSMARTYSTLTPVMSTTGRSGSDSYAFFEQGYPAVFHYERGSNGGYHTPMDILDSLDVNYAVGIIRTGLATALWIDADQGGSIPPPSPAAYALLPNYPNPFNSSTTIPYDLMEESEVRLEIFDLLGRRVALLEEGTASAGRHQAYWDAGAVSSGVYLARLSWPTGSSTRRVLLVR
jgi:leucyl aminopeptidase